MEPQARIVEEDLDQAVRCGVRQRAQQHRVHEAEDRRRRADRQGERRDRDGGETRRLGKEAHGVPQILQQGFDRRQSLFGSIVLAERLQGAKLQHSLAARLRWRHAGA